MNKNVEKKIISINRVMDPKEKRLRPCLEIREGRLVEATIYLDTADRDVIELFKNFINRNPSLYAFDENFDDELKKLGFK